MFDEREVLARYRRMAAWLERERRRRGDTRPDQRWLRRTRLVNEVPLLLLEELMRELREFCETEDS